MSVAKSRDELRNGVVGVHGRQQVFLMYPSESVLIARYTHPDRIDAVCGENANVSHHQRIVTTDVERIDRHQGKDLFGLLSKQQQRVSSHHEIEVLGVVMLAQEAQRISHTSPHHGVD